MLRAPLTRLENYSWFSVPLEPNKGPHSHRPSSQTAIVIITLVLNKGLFCNEEKIMLVVDCPHPMSNVNIKCPMSISNVLSLLLTKHRNEQADLKMTCQLQEKLFKHHAIAHRYRATRVNSFPKCNVVRSTGSKCWQHAALAKGPSAP